MPAICPKNNTECLLRALVDAQAGYDWNPLNFAFTAALSILGFIVATIALFQALLSAGPGRLKASSSAVGDTYSKQAHTRFDRTELRFRTVAKVPLIDISELTSESSRNGLFASSSRRNTPSGTVNTSSPAKQVRGTGAGWCRLLQDLDIEDYPFTTTDCETDYLPDDIQAAPAYTTINDLVLLAMLAGCHTLTKTEDGEGPRARGPSIQLDFRTHPFLGVVAVYQHYGTPPKIKFDREQLNSVTQSATGQLNYAGQRLVMIGTQDLDFYFALSSGKLATAIESRCIDCDHPGCASRKDVLESWKDLLSSDRPSIWNKSHASKITALMFGDKLTGLGLYPSTAADFHSALEKLLNKNSEDEFDYSAIEENLKVLVQAQGGELKSSHAGAGTTAQNRRAWKSDDKSTWFDATVGKKYNQTPEKREGIVEMPVPTGPQHRGALPTGESIGSRDFIFSLKAWSHCVSWLGDKTYYDGLKPEDRAVIRDWIDSQLCEVDYWLRRYGSQDSLCAALNIIKSVSELPEFDSDAPLVLYSASQRLYEDEAILIPEMHTKIQEKYIEIDVLDSLDLPWVRDEEDSNNIIVKKQVSEDLMRELLESSKKVRMEKAAKARGSTSIGTVGIPSALTDLAGQFIATGETGGISDPSNEAEIRAAAREIGPPGNPSDPNDPSYAGFEYVRAPSPSPSVLSAEVPTPSLQQEARDLSALKPMLTLLVYRAVLMACALAARSDTTQLLAMKNRDQVVRVL